MPPYLKRSHERFSKVEFADLFQQVAEPLRFGHGVGVSKRCQCGRVKFLGELAKHNGHVIQVAGRRGEPDKIESRRLRGRHSHRAGLRLDLGNRCGLDFPAHVEPDADAADASRSGRPVGDDLEDQKLLVGRAMDRRRAQQPNVYSSY